MNKTIIKILNRGNNERGNILILTLIFMLVGFLTVTPLLMYMGTGLKTGQIFEQRYGQLYAADAGIEDSAWQINYNHVETTCPGYNPYDYQSDYVYNLTEAVNDHDVQVTIRNTWVPLGLEPPNPSGAQRIITGIPPSTAPKVIVTGNALENVPDTYEIKIQYYPSPDENLRIKQVGIWLPSGFSFDMTGSCNLAGYYVSREIVPHAGGEAVIWTLDEYPFAGAPPLQPFPGVNPARSPMVGKITFKYTGPQGKSPSAVAWIDTNLDLTQGADPPITYAWDADTRVFHVVSTAGNTTVESYLAKNEIRKLGSAIGGDYFATGNSLIGGNLNSPDNYHYRLYNSTQATIITSSDESSGIPASARIEAAYLYWTGWIDWHNYTPPTFSIFHDDCSDFNQWTTGARWAIDTPAGGAGRFRTWGGSNPPPENNTLTLKNSLDLSSYEPGTVTVSWDQSTGGSWDWFARDGFYFAFSGDGGSTWSGNIEAFRGSNPPDYFTYTIPAQYLTDDFEIRFFFNSTSNSRYVYIDNITITESLYNLKYPSSPTAENLKTLVEDTARVNKVLLNNVPVTARTYQTLYPGQFDDTAFEGTWFYTAMSDVTFLLRQWVADGDIDSNGAGNYSFGHYYVGINPEADNYRGNAHDSSYQFDFWSGGGSTGYPLGTPSPNPPPNSRYTAAHAGWSLLIIYSSPETHGHQLFLYDIQNPNFDFFFGWNNNVDFNQDGSSGGVISGFQVPDSVPGETLAGRITVMVGEGDAGYSGDRFIVNGSYLNDGAGYGTNNIWNGSSRGLTVDGIDIDRFDITWSRGILAPGDTSAQINIPTGTDGFTMIYMIISFRSEVKKEGALHYLIRG